MIEYFISICKKFFKTAIIEKPIHKSIKVEFITDVGWTGVDIERDRWINYGLSAKSFSQLLLEEFHNRHKKKIIDFLIVNSEKQAYLYVSVEEVDGLYVLIDLNTRKTLVETKCLSKELLTAFEFLLVKFIGNKRGLGFYGDSPVS